MRHIRVILAAIIIGAILAVGTVQFHLAEGWSWTDSFYFTGTTITTVGYGDLHPTKPETKIFTVVYAIVAIGAFLFAITEITEGILKKRFENMFSFLTKSFNRKRKSNQTTLEHFVKEKFKS
ncbi:MAG: potassium channel family protein [Candidatus Pacearchaeota archaeon]